MLFSDYGKSDKDGHVRIYHKASPSDLGWEQIVANKAKGGDIVAIC